MAANSFGEGEHQLRAEGPRDRAESMCGDPKSRRRLWMRDTRRDRLVTPGGVCHVQVGRVEGFLVSASKPGACLLICDAQVWSSEAVATAR